VIDRRRHTPVIQFTRFINGVNFCRREEAKTEFSRVKYYMKERLLPLPSNLAGAVNRHPHLRDRRMTVFLTVFQFLILA
jgi:hypothetical protein